MRVPAPQLIIQREPDKVETYYDIIYLYATLNLTLNNGVARMLKKLGPSKGDYLIKQ